MVPRGLVGNGRLIRPRRKPPLVWRLKGDTNTFPHPKVLETLQSAAGDDVFPLAMLERPCRITSRSSRLRARGKRRERLRKQANEILATLNDLERGLSGRQTSRSKQHTLDETTMAAMKRTQQFALREAKELDLARREVPLTGVHAIAELLHTPVIDQYSVKPARTTPHIKLIANAIDEPDNETVVDMLEALPLGEASYYASAERRM